MYRAQPLRSFAFALVASASASCFYNPTVSPQDGSAPSTGAAMSTGTADTATQESESSTTAPTGGPESTSSSGDGSSGGDIPVCGDGVVDGPEECDDGNAVDGDACTNACSLAICGDGIVGPVESCDDGNSFDDDACTNACVLATCGDGQVQFGEACDDGAESPTCNQDCTLAACGDGVFNETAGEACDDAGESDTCNAECSPASCGDGVLNKTAGEQCDDGNVAAGDLCSAKCEETKIVQLVMGEYHTCVRFESGTIRCWGAGSYGQLGLGTVVHYGDMPGELPAPNVPLQAKVVGLSAGADFTCAIVEGGGVRCWGSGADGRLGYGDISNLGTVPDGLPSTDLELGSPVADVDLGGNHACAVLLNKSVRCWGNGSSGALGQNATKTIGDMPGEMPPAVVPGLDQAKQIATGYGHTCVLQMDGQVRCWGFNIQGQLGKGNTSALGDGPGELPSSAIDIGGNAVTLAAGFIHTCAIIEGGAVRCWGDAGDGKLGTGNQFNSIGDEPGEMPPSNVPLGGTAVQIAAGATHTCALMTGGKVRCWGNGQYGALGYGNTTDIDKIDYFPPEDVDLGNSASLLAAGGHATCALLVDGTLRCWGINTYGGLGYGHTMNIGDNETPASAGTVPF